MWRLSASRLRKRIGSLVPLFSITTSISSPTTPDPALPWGQNGHSPISSGCPQTSQVIRSAPQSAAANSQRQKSRRFFQPRAGSRLVFSASPLAAAAVPAPVDAAAVPVLAAALSAAFQESQAPAQSVALESRSRSESGCALAGSAPA